MMQSRRLLKIKLLALKLMRLNCGVIFKKRKSICDAPTIRETVNNRTRKVCLDTKEQQRDYVARKKIPICQSCGAKKIEYEPPEFCCSKGSVKLTSHEMPAELLNLYLANTEEFEYFRTYLRMYNNMFAFISLGVNYDKALAKRNHGIYTFKVQGQTYHFINDLIPSNRHPRNLQLYFYDDNTEMLNRMTSSSILRQSVVEKLTNILKINPYYIFLKSLIHISELSNLYIALRSGSGLDQRIYNIPTMSDVAALWLEQEINNNTSGPHIRILHSE
nr:uncharacterized protein LOC108945664 [Nicotiana tomentosiformis]